MARQYHIHEHDMIVWLDFEMRSQLLLFSRLINTPVRSMFEHLNTGCLLMISSNHPESEFVPLTVGNLVRWSISIKCPRLFGSWTCKRPGPFLSIVLAKTHFVCRTKGSMVNSCACRSGGKEARRRGGKAERRRSAGAEEWRRGTEERR